MHITSGCLKANLMVFFYFLIFNKLACKAQSGRTHPLQLQPKFKLCSFHCYITMKIRKCAAVKGVCRHWSAHDKVILTLPSHTSQESVIYPPQCTLWLLYNCSSCKSRHLSSKLLIFQVAQFMFCSLLVPQKHSHVLQKTNATPSSS